MKESVKWTLFQLATLIAMTIFFMFIDQFMGSFGTPTSSNRTMYLTGGILFICISWIYIMFHLQVKKHPKLMDHKIWKVMPVILSIMGIIVIRCVHYISGRPSL